MIVIYHIIEYHIFSSFVELITNEFDVSRKRSVEPYKIRLTNLTHFNSILPGRPYFVDDLINNLITIVRVFWVVRNLFVLSVRDRKCRDLSKVGLVYNRSRYGMNLILRDPTASNSTNLMRRRSFHTSRRKWNISSQETKGNNLSDFEKTKIFKNKKDSSSVRPNKVNRKESLVILVNKEMQKYKTKQDNYNGLIHLLSKPEFLVLCYEEIRGKPGNMTPGFDGLTLDGLTWNWLIKLAETIRRGQFEFSHVRRVQIPKANGKTRHLEVESFKDKIIQKALSVIMEQIWESKFLESSHGFRPNKSVYTALRELYLKGGNYSWVIQGNISKCFDSIPHKIIMKQIGKTIKCARTLELIHKAIKVTVRDLHTQENFKSKIGTPQASVVSPILANIVLHEMDWYMKEYKFKYDKGKIRILNPTYSRLLGQRRYSKDPLIRKQLLKEMKKHHSLDMRNPNFRRLLYVRYADDFVICIIGPKSDAINIKRNIKNFLKDNCALDLNIDKTIISNMKYGFNFLGAHIVKANMLKNHMLKVSAKGTRRATTKLRVNMDTRKVLQKLIQTRIAKWIDCNKLLARGTAFNSMINHSHADIICFYNSKINGLINFNSFFENRSRLHYIIWILISSCGLTLAKKYKVRTLNKIYKKYGKLYTCPETGIELKIPSFLEAIHDYKFNTIQS